MKLKKVLSAVALSAAALFATSAQADSVTDLGLVTSLKSFGGGSLPGAFADIFTFELAPNGGSQYTVSNLTLGFLPPNTFNTLFGTMALFSNPDGTLFNGDDQILNAVVINPASVATMDLTAAGTAGGKYYLFVSGIANGQLGGAYSGAISVSPVPEPETYAMMLAGLAALGFLARRRQG